MVNIIKGFYNFKDKGLLKLKSFCFSINTIDKVTVYKIINTEEFLKDNSKVKTEEVELSGSEIDSNIKSMVFATKLPYESMDEFKERNHCNK